MWFTCNVCNGTGIIDDTRCNICSQYNIYHNGILAFYGHIWCDDNDMEPITPPSSP